MALFKREQSFYIKLAGLASVVALAMVCASFFTQRWTDAIAFPIDVSNVSTSISNVNYGLFKGTLIRRLSYPIKYDLYLTCVWGKNNCAWSCGSDEESRKNEVEQLVNGQTPNFPCINKPITSRLISTFATNDSGNNRARIFMNAGIWLSTIIFMIIVIVALFTSVILSIVNSLKSPVETFFNVQGIYVANGIALVANIVALILYGVAHNVYISRDIFIHDTIVGEYSSEARLGYSYWILILPCVLNLLAIFLIAMREIIIRKDRAETVIDVSVDVPETGVLF